jgi:tetratricopeptide (TPR) repeat protein
VGVEALARRPVARNARAVAGVFVCCAIALLSGCAGIFPQTAALRGGLPQGMSEKVELKRVPFFAQEEYECGPASLAMALDAAGAKVTPEELVPQVYLPARKGSLQVEMLAAARRHGAISYVLAPRFLDVLREIEAGNPVILLYDQGVWSPFTSWHYAVAVGYDYDAGDLVLHSGTIERQVISFPVHELMWKGSGYWAMVAMPPDRIPATADADGWLSSIAALERTGDARNARTAYETFLKRWPGNTNAEIGLANTLYALGELPSAERVLREAAQRAPDNPIVLNNLAQTLSDQNRDAEALPIIERAAAFGGPHAEAVQDTRRAILERLAVKKKN